MYLSGAIGEGAFSQVFKIQRKPDGQTLALKRISRESLNQSDETNVANEIKIHSKLSHKYLVDFVDAFYDQVYIYIILGFVERGNLYVHIDP